jgi:hypothetical protein
MYANNVRVRLAPRSSHSQPLSRINPMLVTQQEGHTTVSFFHYELISTSVTRESVSIVRTHHFSSQSPARPAHLLESTSKWRSPVPTNTKSESHMRRKCTGGEVDVGSSPALLHSNAAVSKENAIAVQ